MVLWYNELKHSLHEMDKSLLVMVEESFLCRKIAQKSEFDIWKGVVRYLDDKSRYVGQIQ